MKIKKSFVKLFVCMMLIFTMSFQTISTVLADEAIEKNGLIDENEKTTISKDLLNEEEIPEDTVDPNKFYLKAGNDMTLEDEVNAGAFISGRNINFDSIIDGIAIIFGQNININGKVLFPIAAAQMINIKGNVDKDLFAAAQIIDIEKSAIVSRDAYMAASQVIIEGEVNRNIYVACETLEISDNAKINGNIYAKADTLSVAKDSVINGKITVNDSAKQGINNENISVVTYATKDHSKENGNNFNIVELLMKMLGFIVVFLVMMLVAGKFFEKIESKYTNGKIVLRDLLLGIAFLLFIPAVVVILIITSVGISLALITFAIYLIAIYMGFIVSAYLIANALAKVFFKKEVNKYLVGIVGIAALTIISVVPMVGLMLKLFGLSAITLAIFKK